MVCAAFVGLTLTSCQREEPPASPLDENKALVRLLIDEVWNRGNLEKIDELLSPEYTLHISAAGVRTDREGYRGAVKAYRDAFSGFQFLIEDMMAEGDKVIIRWTIRGTHTGDYMGVPATGKDIGLTGIAIRRIAGGRIAEEWVEMDRSGLLQQMGAAPPAKDVAK